jgi:hypothetical protein
MQLMPGRISLISISTSLSTSRLTTAALLAAVSVYRYP